MNHYTQSCQICKYCESELVLLIDGKYCLCQKCRALWVESSAHQTGYICPTHSCSLTGNLERGATVLCEDRITLDCPICIKDNPSTYYTLPDHGENYEEVEVQTFEEKRKRAFLLHEEIG